MKTLARIILSTAKQSWADLTGQCLVVLDFDRTLFDTAQYYTDFLEMITRQYGTKVAEHLRTAESTSENFNPLEYLREQGITPETLMSQFDSFAKEQYPSGVSYLFPGAPDLIAYLGRRHRTHCVIITTGTLEYQQFKLRLAPELSEIPIQIISDNKGEILQQQFNRAGGVVLGHRWYSRLVLVDDKASALTPLAPSRRYTLIHVVRPNVKNQSKSDRPDIVEINSLEQVRALIA